MSTTYGSHFDPAKATDEAIAKVSFGRVLIYGFTVLLAVGVTWASFATLDVVSRGMGKVVPSARPQILQNLEGGVLRDLLVSVGDRVERGQEVVRLDRTRFAAELGEVEARQKALEAAQSRLEALIAHTANAAQNSGEIEIAAELMPQDRAIVVARAEDLNSKLAIARAQVEQRIQEQAETQQRYDSLVMRRNLINQRIAMIEPVVLQGYLPQARLLDLQQQLLDVDTQLGSARAQLPRARAATREAEDRLTGTLLNFRSQILEELANVERDLAVVEETLRSADDRLRRTVMKSPVEGIVNQTPITTIGGTVRPGDIVMEIIPVEDTILVEARMSPSDVGFLHTGQEARISLTSYDPSIYGSLTGVVETIGADSLRDERGMSYFNVHVRIDQAYLKYQDRELPIVPGMEATVDVLTGERTVMQYLMKPILRAAEE